MPELQPLYHQLRVRPSPGLFLVDPRTIQRHVLEDQVELWWFREPRRSLMCYCASVALVTGLGLGGVAILSTTTSLSGQWRLGVGTTLCLLSLVVLLKQLLSSAIQDMNCVYSRHRIEQLKSGGRVDPALILLVGLSLLICGTTLICLAATRQEDNPGQDGREMLLSGLALVGAGGTAVVGVGSYGGVVYLRRRRRGAAMMTMRRRRRRASRRLGSGAARVHNVSQGRASAGTEASSSSRTGLV